MKLWKKLFLSMLCLFIGFINVTIYLTVQTVYRTNLNRESSSALIEQTYFITDLLADFQALNGRKALNEESVADLFQRYSNRLEMKMVYLKIQYNRDVYFNNLPLPSGDEESVEEGKRNYTYRNSGGEKYIVIAGNLPGNLSGYTVTYARCIPGFLKEWTGLNRELLVIQTAASCVLIVCLFLMLRRMVSPLEKMSETVEDIAAGNYRQRLPVRGKDEIAQLAEEFNRMANEIEHKINTIEAEICNKQTFIDNMSHEMRTPLASIFGYAEMLQQTVTSREEMDEALEQIMLQSRNLLRLRENLLELTLLRQDSMEKEKIVLEDLISALKRQIMSSGRYGKYRLETDISEKYVKANAILLERLLSNLLENAFRACNDRTSPVVLIESARTEEGGTVICIKDNGKGMTEEEMKHITDPFYRVDKARSRTEGGAGLGLAISRKIVENQGAQMSFDSAPGIGTEVSIIFP